MLTKTTNSQLEIETENSDLFFRELRRACNFLSVTAVARGYEFYVRSPSGEVASGGNVKKTKSGEPKLYKRGDMRAVYKPILDSVVSGGEVASIPCLHYPQENMRSAASGYAWELWGPNSYTTSASKCGKFVELLRY